MFSRIKDYTSSLYNRLTSAPKNDQGMLAGGIIGAAYTAFRAGFSKMPVNTPLAGNVLYESATTRFIMGSLVGGLVGSTYGNRFGQIAEKFFPAHPENQPAEMDNQTFMMKTMPFICGAAANAIIICLPVPGGNPIFGMIHLLSPEEIHILTSLNGLFVGGTIGYRGGKFIDYFTNGRLVADLGLYSGYKYLTKKSQQLVEQKEESVSLTGAANAVNI